MVGKAGLKAGLIGAAVMVVVTLINQFVLTPTGPVVYVACGVSTLLYVLIGVSAGFFAARPRTAGQGAGAGAIAGLISGLISGVVGFAIISLRMSGGEGYPGLDPQQMQQLAQLGLNNPQVLAIPGAVCGAAIGAGAAAIGGAIFAAVKPD